MLMWKKDFLPTKHNSIELYPKCHSLCMAVGGWTSDTNHTHTLCCLSPMLSTSMDEEFEPLSLNKQFSKHKSIISKAATQFLAD